MARYVLGMCKGRGMRKLTFVQLEYWLSLLKVVTIVVSFLSIT
jgi:L-asparagine transporter-like permease